MTIRSFAALLACLIFSSAAGAEDVKEITVKRLKVWNNPNTIGATKPIEIKTAEELEKIFGKQKEAVDAIEKQVDFEKQKLVFFSWSGSGGDKITATADKDDVTFTFKRGLTRDLREHQQMFAIPKEAKFKVETAK